MTTPKLKHVLSIVCGSLSDHGVAHALIGAMAMALYGLPRYTADIDLLADEQHRETILRLMEHLGYQCFQDAGSEAQFDSELGVYGKVDFLFVQSNEGRAILERTVVIKDDTLGPLPVVQPTDYAVLKFMAIANNPERKTHDMADLELLFKASAAGLLGASFSTMEMKHLDKFARRFRVFKQVAHLFKRLPAPGERNK